MAVLYVLFGFVLVILGGKYLVYGSVELANRFKISTTVIGLTVVAFGTSAPELWVSVNANITGHPDIAVGNIIGSNIANITLVLALVALIYPVKILSTTIFRDWVFMFLFAVLTTLFILNDTISRIDAGILFLMLLAFIFISFRQAKKCSKDTVFEPAKIEVWKASLFVVASCVALSYGADFLVQGASDIARHFGIDERTISITLVAFGTSIPELSTSVMAALKKEMEITVGNIIGSNIFNIGAVFGIAGLINPIEIPNFFSKYLFDNTMMLLASMMLLFTILPLYRTSITRLKGGVLLSMYLAYIYLLF